MPFGGFLDSFPAGLFIGAHVVFLLVGIWAAKKAGDAKAPYAALLWLYPITQIVFLAFFGNVITMKTAVLVEQTAMVVLILGIVTRR